MVEAKPELASPLLLQARFGDIDEFAEAIRGWDLDWRQLDAGRLEAKLLQIQTEMAAVTQVSFSRQFLQMGGCPPGVRTFGLIGEGVEELHWCDTRPTDSDILLFPGSDYESVSKPGFRGSTLSFSEEHLAGLAETLGIPHVLDSLDPSGSPATCDREAISVLRNRLRRLRRRAESLPESVTFAATRYELEFEVPAALLTALSSGSVRPRRPAAARRAAGLRRALAHIEERRDEPVRVRDLCKIAGVSWRTLDYAFRERFGVTPKRYLVSIRFEGLRRDLRRASSGTKVADLANRWGFWHMGQLASDYRRRFGELPSATLGKSSSSPV